MPTLRPFRALRPAASGDLSDVICPPYDVISPDERERLLARHPHNVVRLELPAPATGHGGGTAGREGTAGSVPPDDPYKGAARTLVEWRNARVLRKDERPSIYAYEATFPEVPGTISVGEGRTRTVRGFFARVRLEPPRGAILPHERTLSAPKEDRLRLLRATGAQLSPVMALYRGGPETAESIAAVTAGPPASEASDDAGVRHRLWVVRADGPDAEPAQALLTLGGQGPITIADGHHRYETALRYAQERGQHRACESDPPYDYVFMLLFDVATEPLLVLPTHRVVAQGPSGDPLFAAAAEHFTVERYPDADALLATLAQPPDGPRLAVWTGGRAAVLRPLPATLAAVEAAGGVSALGRPLDVAVLAWALERLLGIGGDATAGGSVRYTRDAREAIGLVERGQGTSAFLLDATPVDAVLEVAARGGVMPQKSTYFHPKVATGLLFDPLEA